MKELSIEEKAERYDKAIIRGSQLWESNAITRENYEYIFPELKESEDERIRKALIKYYSFDKDGGSHALDNITPKQIVAWLEKQGNKPQGKSALEAIKEEKVDNANKVVPKFHEGDWVVWDNKISCHIDNIYQGKNSLMYTITDTNNMTRGYSVKGFDNNAHLWTIQDAKDGDVLVEKKYGRPFIFKGLLDINHPTSPVAYCGIDIVDSFLPSEGSRWWTSKEVCPATEEQRNTLMKAMADAGVTFDFEKKELKKIEQKLDTDFSDLRTWKYIVDAVLTEKEGIGQYLDSPFTEEVAKKLQKRFGITEE